MIPPLVSYPNFESFGLALHNHYDDGKSPIRSQKADAFVAQARVLFDKGIAPAPNPTALAILLGVSPKLISSMALKPKRFWRVFQLPKRTGGTREIRAPRVFLKTVQRYILQNILGTSEVAVQSYGFSAGKSIFKNAAVHLGNKWVWNTDLEDFFPTISHRMVREVFRSLGFNANMSTVLASLCTYEGRLAQGAPTSPMLSNIVFRPIDDILSVLALKYGLTYSRYADDLTFSSDRRPTTEFIAELGQVITSAGFRMNKEKTRLHGPHQARYVTGLVVNQKVHPNRETRRRLRAIFYKMHAAKSGDIGAMHKLHGWAAYVNAYDPVLGTKYLNRVREQMAILQARPALSAGPDSGTEVQSS